MVLSESAYIFVFDFEFWLVCYRNDYAWVLQVLRHRVQFISNLDNITAAKKLLFKQMHNSKGKPEQNFSSLDKNKIPNSHKHVIAKAIGKKSDEPV